MSTSSFERPIIASIGFNDGANKGFWRVQPREKFGEGAGQWIEMGAELRMFYKNQRGQTESVIGKAAGSTGTPDGVRVVVQGQKDKGIEDGIYAASTSNVRVAEGFIPEEVLREQGIKNTVKISKEQEALLPTIDQLERADITPDDVRLINEGPNSAEGKQHAEYKKAVESGDAKDPFKMSDEKFEDTRRIPKPGEGIPGQQRPISKGKYVILEKNANGDLVEVASDSNPLPDSISQEVMDRVFYGDNLPSLDSMVEAVSTPPREVSLRDLKPGDVISIGKQGQKTVTRVDPRFDDKFDIYVDDFGQSKKIAKDPLPGSAGVQLVSRAGEGSKKPEKPTATRKPVTPTPAPTSKTPSGKPKPVRTKAISPANLPANRKDDGKDIAPTKASVEELREKKIDNVIDEETGKLILVINEKTGKPTKLQDRNAIANALLEVNPKAKVKENGTVVMERGKFTDTDGTEYAYEVGVQRTIGNQFMERYTFSDPETGEVVHDYYNYDYKDTFAALFGKANGLTRTRDFFLGRAVPGKKGVDADGIPLETELRSYFGPDKTIENRIKFLQKKYGAGSTQRIISPEDNNRRFLDGHGRLINQADGTVAKSFVDDIYESIASNDLDIILDKFVQAMGRMPDTQEAKDALVLEFARGLRERYAGKPEYAQLKHLPKRLNSALLMQDLDIRDIDRIPFVSQDGVSLIVPGTRVEFFNNEGASGIGTVVRLIPGSGKNGGYKDTAVVQFKDKTINNLQTRNMKPLDATDPGSAPTNYVPKLTGDELRNKRIESGELRVDYNERFLRKADDADYSTEADTQVDDAGAPYLGESGVSGDAPEGGFAAEDLLAGDPLYDTDGELLGNVLAVEQVPSADGGPDGYAVTYETPSGEEEIVVLDAGEVRGPK